MNRGLTQRGSIALIERIGNDQKDQGKNGIDGAAIVGDEVGDDRCDEIHREAQIREVLDDWVFDEPDSEHSQDFGDRQWINHLRRHTQTCEGFTRHVILYEVGDCSGHHHQAKNACDDSVNEDFSIFHVDSFEVAGKCRSRALFCKATIQNIAVS